MAEIEQRTTETNALDNQSARTLDVRPLSEIQPTIAGYCIVRNAEYLSYPFYDAIYQCLDNVDEFHIFYDVGSEDATVSLTKKFVDALRDYSSIEMHPIRVDWKDQSAISEAQNMGAQFLKEKGFEFVLLNQADEFLPVSMKEFLRGCYRNKQQVGFDVIHTWKDEYVITKARYCRFYRSDTEFTGDGANVCGTEVNDFILHKDPVHHFGTLFHPQRKYASHSKLYGSKDQEYIAANVNDLDKVQEGFKRLIGTEKFIKRDFPLREREYITVRYSKEYDTYPFDLALQEIVADFRRKRKCKESFAITYSNTQGFRASLAVSPAWTDAYGVVESLIKKFNIKTGAEIGVARGHHSAHLLEANPHLKWIAIDSWKHMVHGYEDPFNRPQEQFDETYESTRKLLGQFGDRITILRKTSREASEIVQEKLDIVFIDANHSYESVKEDIALWWNKVKPGGIIAGHDYDHPNFPGIKRAVDEFLGSKGLVPTIELGTVWWAQKRPAHFLTYIVPCYNCAGTVFEAIKSIYQQHLDIPFEVICTDDGSTDSTREILSYCQKKLPDFHVYDHAQNKGGAAARNTCVAHSRGDLIFCLDSDNILTPDSVGPLIKLLDNTGCDGASFAELRYFEGAKGVNRQSHSWFFEAVHDICDISHILSTQKTPAASGNYLYTRQSYDRAGGYPEDRGAMDAWGFGFRQHATGTRIAILPDSFYWHRLSFSSYWTREEKTGANSRNAARIVREFPELFTNETNRFLATAEAEKGFFGHLERGRLKTVSGQSLVCQSQDAVVSTKGSRGLLPVQNNGFHAGNLQARSDHAEIRPTSDAISRAKRSGSQQEGNPIRLHIGCGPRILKGWVNIDLAFEPYENYMKYYTDKFYGPDVRGTKDDFLVLDVTESALPFADNSVDVIFNEDFIEHLDQKQILLFLAETFRVLKPGGIHRVTTPDLTWIMRNYSDFSKGYSGVYQETWHKWQHKDHLTRRYLEDIAAMVGYRVIFQKRDVSLSPDIPKEYRPDKNNAPDEGHIFADLVKAASHTLLFEGTHPDAMQGFKDKLPESKCRPNRPGKRVRVAEDHIQSGMQIESESSFGAEIRKLFANIRPRKIIETGTFLGRGTTTIIAETLEALGINDAVFYTIEVNPRFYAHAKKYCATKHMNVHALNGLSLLRSMLPDRDEIARRTIRDIDYDGIFVDHKEQDRVELYHCETDFPQVEDGLLYKCLARFDFRPDFVLLDSGGHIGSIEFDYLIENLQGECYIALDDIYHVKHHRSLQRMQSDPRFEVITTSKEKFGFCIGRFTPKRDIEGHPNLREDGTVTTAHTGDVTCNRSVAVATKDRGELPDEGHIFAGLVKVDSNSKSNVFDTEIRRCNNLSYDAETMESDTEFRENTCSETSEKLVQQLRSKGLWRTGQPLRLHLGCGEQYFEGYINIDYPPSEHSLIQVKADIYADIKSLDFPSASVDEVRLHHVFEHFNRVTALAMLIKWHQWLKIGGRIHIETPDLIGSAKTLVSDASWKTKTGVVRHLTGDQAAHWGYHVDHWFAERFERTLKALGFESVQTRSTSWSKEPYLANVEVVAVKTGDHSVQEQLKAAEKLLWESAVAPDEKPTWEVWRKQLHAVLRGDCIASPSNTQAPDVSSISQAPAILSTSASQLPLDEIHDFNQRARDRWVQAKAGTVPAGSRVLDVGAGTCPYRSLFAHCDYRTHDFKKYKGIKKDNTTEYGPIDFVSDITNIPVADESFDVIICTEVLEHVPEPVEALREMARILKCGGRLFVTAPLGSGLHQLPYHYYGGLSPQWYRHFFPKFGLQLKEISPNGGFFKLLAQECARVAWTLPQHQHLHGNNAEFIRNLFKEWLPRYLFALDDKCFIDQFTVGYHIDAEKSPVLTIDGPDTPRTVGRNISRAPTRSRIGGLIFSKDRAMQLQATMESFLLHCRDEDSIDLVVLYKASNELHGGQYTELKKKFPGIDFVEESRFEEQVLSAIEKWDYILFLVDDNIFVKPFSMKDITNALQKEKDAVGFSLRLGRNTNYCYPLGSQQALPRFEALDKGILKYYWPDAEYDFGYPLELSSSVYRCREMLHLLSRRGFVNPNTLENFMNQNKNLYNSSPYLLTYEESVAFTNPVNIVQNVYENKHGTINHYTSEELADCFSQGMKVDVEHYIGLTPNAAHQETRLHFKKDGDPVVGISVIVPCYNHAHYLPEAVESIVNQTYTHWECIIVNDGSSDNSAEVAKRLIADYPDRNIRFIDKPNNTGLADTRNVGIEAATSEWILPLDSDDLFERTFMQKAVDIIQQNEKVDIIFANMQKFGAEQGEWIPSEYSQQKVMFQDTMPYASLYRKALWQKVGGYDTLVGTIRQPEDWNFWISCSKHDPAVRRIAEKLFLYRVDHRSMFHKMIKPNREVSWALLATCHPDLYRPQALVNAWRLIANCPDNIYHEILIAPEKCPEYGLAYFWRALVNKKQGNIEDAMNDCQTAVERAGKNDWQGIFVLMNWQKSEGNLTSAAESLQKLLTIRPDFGRADDRLIRAQGEVRSNLEYWQQLQENQYFEKHQYYAGLKAYGSDFETINKYTSLSKEMTVVVIGCGYGRETLLIAPHVKHVYGIDVNRTILDKADKVLAERGITNFTSVLAKDWKRVVPGNIDLVYSIVVFQHLTRDLVKDYVHGLAKKLSPKGKFVCQFADLGNGTHDAELRPYEPNTRWSKTEIEELIQECGLAKNSIDTQDIPGKGSWHWAFFSQQGARRSAAKILFYFDRIGNLDKMSPAGTVIAILNFARALQSNHPDVKIHITGDLVSRPEQYESFEILPLPSADERKTFLAEYESVFFATHVRQFRETPKRPGQIWIIYQHCWDFDDESTARIEDVDAVICLSDLHRAFLQTRGIDPEKFVVIPNLIDTKLYSPTNVRRDNHSIMFAGGIHPHKGVHLLLDAFQLVRQQMPDVTLHLYGDGAMWRGGDEYGNYLKSVKPQGVYFHGYIDNKDMPEVYSRHGILCLPSALESFGLVTVEAQACGCLPVVHKVGGVAATLADGRTGLLYEPNTPEKLAETVIKAMEMADADPSMRPRAVEFARNNFSTTNAAKYISTLEDRLAIARQRSVPKSRPAANPAAEHEVSRGQAERPQIPETNPLVSVVVPVYNGADYIGQAIESVLTQDYSSFEIIVIDDGSTDETREIVQGCHDGRIRYLRQQNKGVSHARNVGIRSAKGPFIMPLDADDMMAPASISRHLAEFEKHPEVDLVYSDVLLIDQAGHPITVMKKPEYHDRRHMIRDLFRAGHPVVPFRLGIRRSVFDKIGFYDETLLVGEDYDMIRRFVKAGLKAHHLGEPLHLRRMQPNSLSRTYSAQKAQSHFRVVKRFCETFTHEELFPDVPWHEMPADVRPLHAKCLAVVAYLAMGQDFVKSKAPNIYVKLVFEEACLQLNDCLKIDPGNSKIRQLLEKCERGRQQYDRAVQPVVAAVH